jgi:hypothetical protein
VNADDGGFGGKLLLDLPQLRKDVNAVDSPVRPEIEDEKSAAIVGEGASKVARVQPVETSWEIGRANRRRVHDVPRRDERAC